MSVYIWHMKQWGTSLFIGVSLMFLGCSEEHCVSPRRYGYDCEVVQIGAQCWFSENLRTEVYRNGDEIAYCGGDDEWRNAPSGMRCSYEHDAQMDMVYGQLYNGHAVLDDRGLCPTGWHVPSSDDWDELVAFVSEESAHGLEVEGWNGTADWEVGEFLKDSCCWLPEHLLRSPDFRLQNNHGFNAIPSGERAFDGYFSNSGRYGKALWWTSSEVGNEVGYRYVRAIDSALYDATAMKTRGFAVRCIQDAQRVAPNDLME